MNHQTSTVPKVIPQVAYQSPQAPTQLMTESPFGDSGFSVPVFSPVDDPIACLNKAMAFLTAVASSSNATSSRGTNISGYTRVVKCYNCQGEGHRARQCTQLKRPRNAAWYKEKAMLVEAQEIEDLDTYDSDYDDLSTAQAVLMANISNYGSDIISEVPNSDTYLNDMDNQSVYAEHNFEQTPVMNFTDSEISSDSNIIPYSQYLQETQQATVQDTHSQAQQDLMILSVIEQMSKQMINHVNNWEKANKEQNNESITTELEIYKERVKTFEQRLNIDLTSREKMIDSQMDDMIREKLALKEQIDSLEQNLSKQIKKRNLYSKLFQLSKMNPKKKKINIWKMKLIWKRRLRNLIISFVKWAQRLKPTLYDGVILSNTHVVMPVNDDKETLILEEESRSKMSEKAKTPEVIAKKISHKPINYANLNSLYDDFETRFSPQQELSAEQAFWFHIHNPSIESSYTPPVIMEVPSELPKCDSCEKCFNLDAELSKSKQAYNDLLKNHSQLEKHCISLKVSMQLKHEVFQNDKSCVNHNDVEIQEYFEINDLKAQLQDKDKTICKLKDTIRSLSKNAKEENVNHDKCELEPINEELENSVVTLLLENGRLCNEINHVKQDLKAQIQDKVFVITSLKYDLQKLKGKEIVKNVVHTPSVPTITPGMFKLDLEPLPPRLLQNREVHIAYIRNTQEQANILQEIVKQAKAKQSLDSELELACKYITRIQELLVYVQDMCPNAIPPSTKKVTVKPMNNVKKVRSEVFYSNCGSKPPGNKRNDMISQSPSKNKKNKVEAQLRKVNKVNRVVKPVCDVDVKHSLSKANSEILCATCNKSSLRLKHKQPRRLQ
ncbi:retrovirus-related pol polyprotein from transposon TNT 1-94 [Tanacetum coccineum]